LIRRWICLLAAPAANGLPNLSLVAAVSDARGNFFAHPVVVRDQTDIGNLYIRPEETALLAAWLLVLAFWHDRGG
jgi:hypothetical protein